MDKIKIRVGGRMRTFTSENAVKFFEARKPTPKEAAFVDAYLRGGQRNAGKAYAIAYPRAAAWPQAKRLKVARKLLQRPAVHKLLNERMDDLVHQLLGMAPGVGQDQGKIPRA